MAGFASKGQWLQFEKEKGTYTLYHGNSSVEDLHLVIDVDQLKGNFINLESKKQFSVWINQQLWMGPYKEHHLDLNSLKKQHGNPFTLSLVQKGGVWTGSSLPKLQTSYSSSMAVKSGEKTSSGLQAWQLDYFLSPAFVIWLILIAAFKAQYPKIWNEYYNPGAIFLRRINQDALIQARQFNPATLWALGLSSYQLVFAFMLYLPHLQGYPPLLNRLFHAQAGLMLLTLFIGSLVLILFFFLKFLLIRFLTGLFGFSSFSSYHFFDYLRLSSIIYSSFILVGLILHWQDTIQSQDYFAYLIWLFFGLLVFRVFYLMARLLATTHLQFSYLFSYLCTTEIIPLALGIHWILKG
jgi:hypothetical protein